MRFSYREEFRMRMRKEMRTGWTAQVDGLALDGMEGEIHFLYCSDLWTALILESPEELCPSKD